MKAIVLCGGNGSKMFPYNMSWQKCCLPIGNVPNLIHITKYLRQNKINDITFLTDYREQQVNYILRNEKNIKIVNAPQNKIIEKIIGEIDEKENDYIIYYGDTFLGEENIKNLISTYKKNGNAMLYEKFSRENFKLNNYIGVKVEEEKIKSIFGHPRNSYANGRSCGIFCISKEVLKKVSFISDFFPKVPVGGMPTEEFYFEKCVQLALDDKVNFTGVETITDYVDLNFPWDILKANEICLDISVKTIKANIIAKNSKIDSKSIIKGNIILGENSVIEANAIIEGNVIIGDNTIIGSGSIIGENCIIGNYSTVKHNAKISSGTVIGNFNKIGFCAEISGVTFDNVSAVHTCQLGGIIGKNVDVASGCQMGALRFDDEVQSQIVKNKKYFGEYTNSVFVGDSVRMGVGNVFYPGVKIGCNTCLGPGLIIDEDISNNKLVIAKQEKIIKDWGSDKYGW